MADHDQGKGPDKGEEINDPIEQLVLKSGPYLPVGVLGGALVIGYARGPGAGLLTLAGGVLLGAIAATWSSLRTLFGETPLSLDEAIHIGAPGPNEERKRSLLAALRDVRFEHKLGNLSDDDFKELEERYRGELREVLEAIDHELEPAKKKAEELVTQRLSGQPEVAEPEAPRKKKGKGKGKADDKADARADDKADKADARADDKADRAEREKAAPAKTGEGEKAAGQACAHCEATNDADAAFCKRCGKPLGQGANPEADKPVEKSDGEGDRAAEG